MIYFFNGKIVFKQDNFIIINVHDIAYQVFVSNISLFKIDEQITIYTHLVIKPEDIYLIGFLTLEEKRVFLSLIKVKGIGPKTALSILGNVNIDDFLKAISTSNIGYLKKIKGIGSKAASQILLDYKGEFLKTDVQDSKYQEIFNALKQLGFSSNIINDTLIGLDISSLSSEEAIKTALVKIRRKKNG